MPEGDEDITSRFRCAALYARYGPMSTNFYDCLWNLSLVAGGFRAVTAVRKDDVVALDHAVEGFAIDVEDTGCGLLISPSVLQHAGNVATFDLRQRDPVIIRRITRRCLLGTKGIVADALR